MKFFTAIYLLASFLSADTIYFSSDIDEMKRKSINYISFAKKEFLSIKNKMISPYNKEQFSYETYLDSLYFLSKELDNQRKNIFSELIRLDLNKKNIQFFDNLKKESILLYNIINGFGRIYHSYLNYNNTNNDYSFEQYDLEMKNLVALEKKLFSSKF